MRHNCYNIRELVEIIKVQHNHNAGMVTFYFNGQNHQLTNMEEKINHVAAVLDPSIPRGDGELIFVPLKERNIVTCVVDRHGRKPESCTDGRVDHINVEFNEADVIGKYEPVIYNDTIHYNYLVRKYTYEDSSRAYEW